MNHSRTRSQRNLSTVEYLLAKDNPQKRKISEFQCEPDPRENFVLTHQAESFSVNRVYIDSLYSPNIRLYYTKFTPAQRQATICIVHGYGQCSDDFIQMATYFAQNRFVVNIIDLRGFGYSGGTRVYESFKGLLSDIQNLLRRCCGIGLPTYILSHGFGSLLTFALLQENPQLPLSGVISLSPLFEFPCFKDANLFSKLLLSTISLVWPDVLISNRINPTALTNNPLKIKSCLDGVFNYQFISINMANAHSKLSEKALADASKFIYPILVLHGAKDTVQPIQEVKRFYKLIGSTDKKSYVFKNGLHELFKDEKAETEVYPKILDWIFETDSRKNDVRWAVTAPFKLDVINKWPSKIRHILYVLVPTLIGLILLLRRLTKGKK